jgi:GTP cyclohydrolase I
MKDQPGEKSGWFYQGVKMEFENNADDHFPVNIDIEAVKKIIYELLGAVGEDPGREGLKNTPDRVARMYSELLGGYRDVPEKVIKGALFDVQYDEM